MLNKRGVRDGGPGKPPSRTAEAALLTPRGAGQGSVTRERRQTFLKSSSWGAPWAENGPGGEDLLLTSRTLRCRNARNARCRRQGAPSPAPISEDRIAKADAPAPTPDRKRPGLEVPRSSSNRRSRPSETACTARFAAAAASRTGEKIPHHPRVPGPHPETERSHDRPPERWSCFKRHSRGAKPATGNTANDAFTRQPA